MKGQLGNGPLVKKPTWNPAIRDNGSIGNVSTWIMFYWKLYLGLNHFGKRGFPTNDVLKLLGTKGGGRQQKKKAIFKDYLLSE